MKVKTNKHGKIYIVNTDLCDIELPNEYLGTNLSKYVYIDDEWSVDSCWTDAENLLGVDSEDVALLYGLYCADETLKTQEKDYIINLIEENKAKVLAQFHADKDAGDLEISSLQAQRESDESTKDTEVSSLTAKDADLDTDIENDGVLES